MVVRVLKAIWTFISTLVDRVSEDRVPRMAAAISYYTIFALAPVLVIVIWLLGLIYGPEAARGEIVGRIQGLIGVTGANLVQTVLQNAGRERSGIIPTVLGFATLVIASTGVFVEIQDSLNNIWGVAPKPGQPIISLLRTRFTSFVMVLSVGFVLLASLVASSVVSAIGGFVEHRVPILSDVALTLLRAADFILPLLVIILMFALIYRVLPDVEIAWRDVWVGAILTSVLFTIGKYLIGLYLGQSGLTSTYGAAGSLVVLLVWVYFSSLIFLVGAEITQMYANHYGARVRPSPYAIRVGRREVVRVDHTVTASGQELLDDERERPDPGTGDFADGRSPGPDDPSPSKPRPGRRLPTPLRRKRRR